MAFSAEEVRDIVTQTPHEFAAYIPDAVGTVSCEVSSSNRLFEFGGGDTVEIAETVYSLVLKPGPGRWEERRYRATAIDMEQMLVPLGTFPSERTFSVCRKLGGAASETEIIPLTDGIVSLLPDEVLLTRALSRQEAKKFERGDTDLGSPNVHCTDMLIHTALQNVTNEFKNDNNPERSRVVGFLLARDELAGHFEENDATLGTYDTRFQNRDPESTFPFDMEIRFRLSAIPSLLAAYGRWADRTGVPSIASPFYRV